MRAHRPSRSCHWSVLVSMLIIIVWNPGLRGSSIDSRPLLLPRRAGLCCGQDDGSHRRCDRSSDKPWLVWVCRCRPLVSQPSGLARALSWTVKGPSVPAGDPSLPTGRTDRPSPASHWPTGPNEGSPLFNLSQRRHATFSPGMHLIGTCMAATIGWLDKYRNNPPCLHRI